MINPVNGYWTAENYPTLSDYLLKQAYNYIENHSGKLTQTNNRIDPEEIVNRVRGDNAYNFKKNIIININRIKTISSLAIKINIRPRIQQKKNYKYLKTKNAKLWNL